MARTTLLAALVALICLSCSSPTDGIPVAITGGEPPVATGIYVVDVTGRILGFRGRPSSDKYGYPNGPDKANQFSFYLPMPNPFWSSQMLAVRIPAQGKLRIWVVRARAAGDPVVSESGAMGAAVPVSGVSVAAVLMDAEVPAGNHQLNWKPVDKDGDTLPEGYYRIYAQWNDSILWQDVLFVSSPH